MSSMSSMSSKGSFGPDKVTFCVTPRSAQLRREAPLFLSTCHQHRGPASFIPHKPAQAKRHLSTPSPHSTVLTGRQSPKTTVTNRRLRRRPFHTAAVARDCFSALVLTLFPSPLSRAERPWSPAVSAAHRTTDPSLARPRLRNQPTCHQQHRPTFVSVTMVPSGSTDGPARRCCRSTNGQTQCPSTYPSHSTTSLPRVSVTNPMKGQGTATHQR